MHCAGSERVGKSEATGDRLEEAKHINKSLSALGKAMTQLTTCYAFRIALTKLNLPPENMPLTARHVAQLV